MSVTAQRDSWDSGGLSFSQSTLGARPGEDEGETWDDTAILKAFDDALSTHTRKAGGGPDGRRGRDIDTRRPSREQSSLSSPVSTRRLDAGIPLTESSQAPKAEGDTPQGAGSEADHRHQVATAARVDEIGQDAKETESHDVQRIGIPGPWIPVSSKGEAVKESHASGAHGEREKAAVDRDGVQRIDYSANWRAEEHPGATGHGPHHQAHQEPASGVSGPAGGGGAAWERNLPPQMPPPPHPTVGLHAAAFQSLDGVHDDDLADLLLAWYYSGYYTGRYRAMQEARHSRYNRSHPPPPVTHAPPPVPTSRDGWERTPYDGYHAHPVPSPPGHAERFDGAGGGGRAPHPRAGAGEARMMAVKRSP